MEFADWYTLVFLNYCTQYALDTLVWIPQFGSLIMVSGTDLPFVVSAHSFLSTRWQKCVLQIAKLKLTAPHKTPDFNVRSVNAVLFFQSWYPWFSWGPLTFKIGGVDLWYSDIEISSHYIRTSSQILGCSSISQVDSQLYLRDLGVYSCGIRRKDSPFNCSSVPDCEPCQH